MISLLSAVSKEKLTSVRCLLNLSPGTCGVIAETRYLRLPIHRQLPSTHTKSVQSYVSFHEKTFSWKHIEMPSLHYALSGLNTPGHGTWEVQIET